jgi:hypothetical protein
MHSEDRPDLNPFADSLEDRLRALPSPPVPVDLEARLLAGIPKEIPPSRGRLAIWIGMSGLLAAACVLAMLAWPRRPAQLIPKPSPREIVHPGNFQVQERPGSFVVLQGAQRAENDSENFSFTWPLEESSPWRATPTIPPDLLN